MLLINLVIRLLRNWQVNNLLSLSKQIDYYYTGEYVLPAAPPPPKTNQNLVSIFVSLKISKIRQLSNLD